MTDFKAQRNIEKLELLAGSRSGASKTKAAVRVEDLNRLLNYSYRLKSETVTAAPTAAQHNDLVQDVKALHSLLNEIAASLKDRAGL